MYYVLSIFFHICLLFIIFHSFYSSHIQVWIRGGCGYGLPLGLLSGAPLPPEALLKKRFSVWVITLTKNVIVFCPGLSLLFSIYIQNKKD